LETSCGQGDTTVHARFMGLEGRVVAVDKVPDDYGAAWSRGAGSPAGWRITARHAGPPPTRYEDATWEIDLALEMLTELEDPVAIACLKAGQQYLEQSLPS
jgi:hypothetical protein